MDKTPGKRSAVRRNTRAPAELTEEQKIRFVAYDVYGLSGRTDSGLARSPLASPIRRKRNV